MPEEFWSRWRVRAGYPVALVFLWLAHPTVASLVAGATVSLPGLLIRGAAAGHLRKHEALATSGPYAWTRNPLYLGSAVLAVALLVAGHSWGGAILVVAYFALFYPVVIRREEQDLRAHYGRAFEEYAARVPLFWPHAPRDAPSPRPFSWELYRRNREYQAALGVILMLVLLVLRMAWRW